MAGPGARGGRVHLAGARALTLRAGQRPQARGPGGQAAGLCVGAQRSQVGGAAGLHATWCARASGALTPAAPACSGIWAKVKPDYLEGSWDMDTVIIAGWWVGWLAGRLRSGHRRARERAAHPQNHGAAPPVAGMAEAPRRGHSASSCWHCCPRQSAARHPSLCLSPKCGSKACARDGCAPPPSHTHQRASCALQPTGPIARAQVGTGLNEEERKQLHETLKSNFADHASDRCEHVPCVRACASARTTPRSRPRCRAQADWQRGSPRRVDQGPNDERGHDGGRRPAASGRRLCVRAVLRSARPDAGLHAPRCWLAGRS